MRRKTPLAPLFDPKIKYGGIEIGGTPGTRIPTHVYIVHETDTALSISKSKARLAGVATETDSALSIPEIKMLAVGVSAETDSALSIPAIKMLTIGVSAEADTAEPIGIL